MTHLPQNTPTEDPLQFWQNRYAAQQQRQRGRAGLVLQQQVGPLTPGRALELGCSTGDDSLWLAEQGWQVTATDISPLAVEIARRLAQEAGLAERMAFFAGDLAQGLPAGEFELVCALYFQSPFDFPRAEILQAAAARLVPGGHLLLVSHAAPPPWADPEHARRPFPTLASEQADLALAEADWELLRCEVIRRPGKGPDGQEAELEDNLILARRRQGGPASH